MMYMIPMDTCPLLLGQPWLFNRKVMHDVYENDYTFYKYDINVTLGPSRNERISEPHNGEENIFSFMTVF